MRKITDWETKKDESKKTESSTSKRKIKDIQLREKVGDNNYSGVNMIFKKPIHKIMNKIKSMKVDLHCSYHTDHGHKLKIVVH